MREQNEIAQIIINKRKTGYYSAFNQCEIPFISKCPDLSDGEKLLWINLATRTTLDASLSCKASLNQIAQMVGKKANTIFKSIKKLVSLGFLNSEFDEKCGVNTYYVLLPEEGLQELENAPNRGEKQNSFEEKESIIPECPQDNVVQFKTNEIKGEKNHPMKNIIGGIGNISYPPYEKNHTLYIKYNNKNKIHNNHNTTEVKDCDMQNADALILKFQDRVEEVKRNNPNISLCKANLIAHQAFAQEEQDLIHHALIEKSQNQERKVQDKQIKSCNLEEKPKNNAPVPNSRTRCIKSKLVELNFDAEHFLIEEDVKDQILGNIPKLYHLGKIKGQAATKPLKTLMKEIFYYVAKAGSMSEKPEPQLKRYYTARKILLDGGWERPIGLAREEVLAREHKWQAEKRIENEAAKRFVGING